MGPCGHGWRGGQRGLVPRLALLAVGLVLMAACADVTDPDPGGPAETAPPRTGPIQTPLDPTTPHDDPTTPRRAADLPIEVTEVTGAAWNGRIIAVGGLDRDGAAVAAVHLYDPAADRWDAGPDLPVGLHHTAVETLGDRVFVVGGYAIEAGRWVALADVWSLGPGDATWRDEPRLRTPRGALAVASTGDRLVAVGGVGPDRQVLPSTETLTEGADAWQHGPDLGAAREHLDATAVGDEVYAIAGRAGGLQTNHASVEVLRDGAWIDAAPVRHARGGIGADTIDGLPCVAGGEEPAATVATVECLIGGDWQVVADLEVPRHGLVVVALDGQLHVVGGGPQPGLTVSSVHEVIPIPAP